MAKVMLPEMAQEKIAAFEEIWKTATPM